MPGDDVHYATECKPTTTSTVGTAPTTSSSWAAKAKRRLGGGKIELADDAAVDDDGLA